MQKILTISFQTFNRSKFLEFNLKKLISEIFKFNLQDKISIFIADDKSVDNTLKIIKKYKNKYPKIIDYYSNKKNLGLPANTFKIIKKSPKSKYLWLLSDDDFLKEDRLAKVVKILEEKKPDVLYLNYQLVNTFLEKKQTFIPIKSIIGPGLNIKKNFYLNSKKEYFDFISKIGFYNLRMILAQQSIVISKSSILKKNLNLVKKEGYDMTKEFYPFDLTLYINLPEKFMFLKEKLLFITTNNRGWNFDVLKANEIVKKYFNPLQKMILKKYSNLMPLKLKFLLYLSIIYTHLVPIVYKTAKLLQLDKILNKAQFGDEK